MIDQKGYRQHRPLQQYLGFTSPGTLWSVRAYRQPDWQIQEGRTVEIDVEQSRL